MAAPPPPTLPSSRGEIAISGDLGLAWFLARECCLGSSRTLATNIGKRSQSGKLAQTCRNLARRRRPEPQRAPPRAVAPLLPAVRRRPAAAAPLPRPRHPLAPLPPATSAPSTSCRASPARAAPCRRHAGRRPSSACGSASRTRLSRSPRRRRGSRRGSRRPPLPLLLRAQEAAASSPESRSLGPRLPNSTQVKLNSNLKTADQT